MFDAMFVCLNQFNLLIQEFKITQIRDSRVSRDWLREFDNARVFVLLECLKCTNEKGGDPFI